MASQVDDFEDQDMGEYNGDTATFEFDSGSTISSGGAQSGTYALTTPQDGSFYNARSLSSFSTTLNDYPEAGDTFDIHLQTNAGTQSNEGVVCWAIQEDAWVADGGYCIRWDWGGPSWKLQKLPTGGTNFSDLATADTPSRPAGEWNRFEVDWASDGTMTVTQYDADGTQVDQVSATDSDWSSGGVAVELKTASGGDGQWIDNYVITQEAGATTQSLSEVSVPVDTFSETGTFSRGFTPVIGVDDILKASRVNLQSLAEVTGVSETTVQNVNFSRNFAEVVGEIDSISASIVGQLKSQSLSEVLQWQKN